MLYLDITESTNNYAMQLIDADKAQHGTTIVAGAQTGGKGQRGKTWRDIPGQSLLMSIVTVPEYNLDHQFLFSAQVAVAVADALGTLDHSWQIHIKWPNDIIIDDKKAGGILIENIIRGNKWLNAVVGLGLNVLQEEFDPSLPYATSLKMASGKTFNVQDVQQCIREAILSELETKALPGQIMERYNTRLYRRGAAQTLLKNDHAFTVLIDGVLPDGCLSVRSSSGIPEQYMHGEVEWKWG